MNGGFLWWRRFLSTRRHDMFPTRRVTALRSRLDCAAATCASAAVVGSGSCRREQPHEPSLDRLSRRRRRGDGHGVHRRARRSRGRARHARRSPPRGRRALARRVSIRPAAPSIPVLRRRVDPPRNRCGPDDGAGDGAPATRARLRDPRVLRPRPPPALSRVRAGDVPRGEEYRTEGRPIGSPRSSPAKPCR